MNFKEFVYLCIKSMWIVFLFWSLNVGFLDSSAGKESAYNAGDLGSTPGLGRSSEEGKDYPIQYSGLENSMDCIVHGVAKSWTGLSYFTFNGWFYSLVCLFLIVIFLTSVYFLAWVDAYHLY